MKLKPLFFIFNSAAVETGWIIGGRVAQTLVRTAYSTICFREPSAHLVSGVTPAHRYDTTALWHFECDCVLLPRSRGETNSSTASRDFLFYFCGCHGLSLCFYFLFYFEVLLFISSRCLFFLPLSQLTCVLLADHLLCISVLYLLLCLFVIIICSCSRVSFSHCVLFSQLLLPDSSRYFSFALRFCLVLCCFWFVLLLAFVFLCLSCCVFCLLLANLGILEQSLPFVKWPLTLAMKRKGKYIEILITTGYYFKTKNFLNS